MSQISLQNLKKSFGKTQVIHDLSIDVKDGELIVIVGPSGCGKSTLLRMVAGLEDANEGNILIDNKKVNELEPMERNIAIFLSIGSSSFTFLLSIKIFPSLASSSPATILNNVDFPQPEGPTITISSPSFTSILRS